MWEAECLKIKDRTDLENFTQNAARVSLTDLIKGASQPAVFKRMFLDRGAAQVQLPIPGWPESTYKDRVAHGFHGTHYGFTDGEEIFSDWPELAMWVAWDIKLALCKDTRKKKKPTDQL